VADDDKAKREGRLAALLTMRHALEGKFPPITVDTEALAFGLCEAAAEALVWMQAYHRLFLATGSDVELAHEVEHPDAGLQSAADEFVRTHLDNQIAEAMQDGLRG